MRSSSLGTRLCVFAGLLIAVTFLAGCVASESFNPPAELVAAVADETKDTEALGDCSSIYPGGEFISALNSTASDVRDLAQPGPGGTVRDIENLPEDGDTYIAICISQLPEENPFHADLWALWMTKDSTATGIVAVWNHA